MRRGYRPPRARRHAREIHVASVQEQVECGPVLQNIGASLPMPLVAAFTFAPSL